MLLNTITTSILHLAFITLQLTVATALRPLGRHQNVDAEDSPRVFPEQLLHKRMERGTPHPNSPRRRQGYGYDYHKLKENPSQSSPKKSPGDERSSNTGSPSKDRRKPSGGKRTADIRRKPAKGSCNEPSSSSQPGSEPAWLHQDPHVRTLIGRRYQRGLMDHWMNPKPPNSLPGQSSRYAEAYLPKPIFNPGKPFNVITLGFDSAHLLHNTLIRMNGPSESLNKPSPVSVSIETKLQKQCSAVGWVKDGSGSKRGHICPSVGGWQSKSLQDPKKASAGAACGPGEQVQATGAGQWVCVRLEILKDGQGYIEPFYDLKDEAGKSFGRTTYTAKDSPVRLGFPYSPQMDNTLRTGVVAGVIGNGDVKVKAWNQHELPVDSYKWQSHPEDPERTWLYEKEYKKQPR